MHWLLLSIAGLAGEDVPAAALGRFVPEKGGQGKPVCAWNLASWIPSYQGPEAAEMSVENQDRLGPD
ncbi:hypothetical protein E4U41_005721 [Claviceps citrina]|nr:hypothetical protein E4U41_005721 [Claviceps citrina]